MSFVGRPIISSGLQQRILNQLISLFDGVAAHHQCVRDTRKKTRAAISSSHEQGGSHVGEPNQGSASAPSIIPHITVGINEVTKALETEVRSSRQTVVTVVIPSPAIEKTRASLSTIFICYADLDTPALVAHLPQLIALCNSARSENHKIKVIQLPAGAQSSLVNALGYLNRISVLALDVWPCHLLL
jgi:ribonuclease P/MRP protein subunit POP3